MLFVKLYVRRVFFMDDYVELSLSLVRFDFVLGAMDSEDLPLNVSRAVHPQVVRTSRFNMDDETLWIQRFLPLNISRDSLLRTWPCE